MLSSMRLAQAEVLVLGNGYANWSVGRVRSAQLRKKSGV